MILISSGGPPGTPLTEKPGASDLPIIATWSPSVGSVSIPMMLTSAPPGVTCAQFQTFALGTDGVWRPDPLPFVLQLGGGGGGGCDGCTPADQIISSITGWPGLVPVTLAYASGNFAAPPPPPQRVRYARVAICLGFGGTAAPPPGTYVVGLG